jgi:uncharacterized membrane protein YfcA
VQLSPLTLAALILVAFIAGVVDAIAGGGGLITLPALLAAGLDPHLALGTNKGQSVFGSFASVFRYSRAGLVSFDRAKVTFPSGAIGAFAGAALLLVLDRELLKPLVLFLLIAAGLFLAIRRPGNAPAGPPPPSATLRAAAIALIVGAYDGFFGPGTGTFLIIAFVGLLRSSLPSATADAKVVNFASNLATVILLGLKAKVLWAIALPMALGQFAGGMVGASLAIKGGARIIRGVVLGVVLGLVAKLTFDLLTTKS